MKQDDFMPLQEYLDTLPDPVTLREKLLCCLSNLIDGISIKKYKIKRRNKRGRSDQPEGGS